MPFDFMRAHQKQPARKIFQRIVFICRHPFFDDEERMLSQELFEPRYFRNQLGAYNECRERGNTRETANRAFTRLFGQCDFVELEEVGSVSLKKGLSEFDVTCRIYRVSIAEQYDFFFRKTNPETFLALPPAIAKAITPPELFVRSRRARALG